MKVKKNDAPEQTRPEIKFWFVFLFVSVPLILIGALLYFAGSHEFLTHSTLGALLVLNGLILALIIGIMPFERSRMKKQSKNCANCGAKIAGGYLCSDCQEKLERI